MRRAWRPCHRAHGIRTARNAVVNGLKLVWTERAYHNLVYYNQVDKGGHFAAWEQPELFASEVRATFRFPR
jgi:pimeloyl-ACP methyl ester carboxylesterase